MCLKWSEIQNFSVSDINKIPEVPGVYIIVALSNLKIVYIGNADVSLRKSIRENKRLNKGLEKNDGLVFYTEIFVKSFRDGFVELLREVFKEKKN